MEEVDLKPTDLETSCACCFMDLGQSPKRKKISKIIEDKFIEVTQCDFFSKTFASFICSSCYEKLFNFSKFKEQLKDNQLRLQTVLNQINNIEDADSISVKSESVEEYEEEEYVTEYLEDFIEEDPQEEFFEIHEVDQVEKKPPLMKFLEVVDHKNYSRAISNKPKQICPICAKYLAVGSLESHMMRKHSDEYNFYCDQCPQKFKVKRDIVSHVMKHTKIEYRKKFQCEFCQNCYIKKASLDHHIKMRHDTSPEEFECECGSTFKTELRLRYHKRLTHHKGEYHCEVCDKIYPSMHNLRIHISHFHKTKNPCTVCGKLVAPGTFMKRHMKIHDPPSVECDVCLKTFTVRETMLEHQRTVHGMGETLFCHSCGKTFGSKKTLKRHIDRTHTVKEKVQCEIEGCSYAANRRDNLINHVKIHKGLTTEYRDDYIVRIRAMKNLSW